MVAVVGLIVLLWLFSVVMIFQGMKFDMEGEWSNIPNLRQPNPDARPTTSTTTLLSHGHTNVTGRPFLQGFCGGDSLSLYSVYIFKKSNVALNGYVLSVLLQVGFTVGYVVSVPFMGHVGRRPQYFVSSVLLATAMVVLGASLYAMVSVPGCKYVWILCLMCIILFPEYHRRVPTIPRWCEWPSSPCPSRA